MTEVVSLHDLLDNAREVLRRVERGERVAGAAGLVLGPAASPCFGAVAAVGLVVFFIGAVIVHVRAGVYYNITFLGLYLASAATVAVYMIRLSTDS